MDRSRLPLLLVAVLAVAGGMVRVWAEGRDGFLLAGAGLVLLGLWAGSELTGRGKGDRDE